MQEKFEHIEEQESVEQESIDFSNFEDLSQTNISKEVFEQIYSNFEQETYQTDPGVKNKKSKKNIK